MDELKSVLDTAFAGEDIQVAARLNLNPSAPTSVDIYPGDPFREETAAGFTDLSGMVIFTVRARVDVADTDSAQDALLRLMDDDDDICLAAALEDDQTLNGWASSVKVEGPSGYIPYGDNPGVLLGCQWKVSVLRAFS